MSVAACARVRDLGGRRDDQPRLRVNPFEYAGCRRAAGDNGNVTFDLNSSFSTSVRTIKAQSTGGLSAGKGIATSQIFYEFDVGGTKNTAGHTIGAWVNYSVNWQGYQVILNTLGTNASVVIELVLRDMTDNQNLNVETIHALDLKTYSLGQIDVGFDFNDLRTKVGTFAAVLKRGHSYRLTLRMSTTLFVLTQSGVPSTCDYMDGFEGGGNGGVRLDLLNVKAGLDEKEQLRQVADLEDKVTVLGNKVTGLENKVTSLENNVTLLEDHRHIYLTGPDPGQNSTQAESSGPMPPAPIPGPRRPASGGEHTPANGAASKPSSRFYKPLLKRHPDERRPE